MENINSDHFSPQEQEPVNTTRHAATWGLYLGIALSLSTIVTVGTLTINSVWESIYVWCMLLVLITLGALSLRRKLPGGTMTYGQSLKHGFLQSLFAAILVSAVFILMAFVIKPEYKDVLRQEVETNLMATFGDADQVAQSMQMVGFMHSPIFLSVTIFFGTILNGLIVALITSIFTKRTPTT